MTMTEVVKTAVEAGILRITLNRPEKYNALSGESLGRLAEIFESAKTDAAVQAVLITGAGKAFCAGADISQLAQADAETGLVFAEQGQRVFRALETLGKPSLAAVNGYAFGGGCELAIAATLRIAASVAQFGQPEVKLGVIPGYGGTQRLPRLIGQGRAMLMCLQGDPIDAQMALDWGLVTEVVEPDQLLSRGIALLTQLTERAPLALRATMTSIQAANDLPLEKGLAFEAQQFSQTCATEDKQEGVSAFLEKRAAQFRGV